MKIHTVEYVGTLVDPSAPFPDALPQVAFAGRSNVGKSSLINTILNRTRKKIAHVSATPGKTQALNFFRVNDEFLLVDLPGFGFAKVPMEVKGGWKALVEGYLARPDGPKAVVHLLDVRRDPTPEDVQMLEYLAKLGVPALLVLTKVDKFSKSRKINRVRELVKEFGLDPEQVVPFSSKTGEGRELLLGALSDLLAQVESPEGA
ncbi:MAG: YihA family ribosome biogenesis GTP-binding protein [Gemmatimonadales bacterium]|nr:MAG: YihA family ribosome biogenesis GTP-binding protein [Gemmatimonadales bacterium]